MGRSCIVRDCNVNERTPSESPLFHHVHPAARGMMFRVNAERLKAWKDLLIIEKVASSEVQLVCCRHFSLLQYNEIRLSRGCRFNILNQEAYPDIFLPGQENSPHAIIYKEIEQENHFQDDDQLPGNAVPISSCFQPETTVVNAEQDDYLMDSSETTSQKSQLQKPIEAGGQCSTNTNIQISKNKEVATKNGSGDQSLIILQIAIQKSKTYDSLCQKIYKNQSIPEYAEKTEYFYARNVSELVSRHFLRDVFAAMRKQDKEIDDLKKKNKELEKSKALVVKQKEWFERAAKEKAKLLKNCVTCAQELS